MNTRERPVGIQRLTGPKLGESRRAGLALIVAVAASGCAGYREVEQKGGIEAALKSQGPGASDWDYLLASGVDPEERALSDQETATLRRTEEDGSVTLISRSPSHVMYHLTQTLRNKEYDLLLDQVISDATKSEYRKRAADPMDAVRYLTSNEREIQSLFAAMPLGDQTPGVLFETIGPNQFRLAPPAAISHELKFKHFDVIIERREFRLLMIR